MNFFGGGYGGAWSGAQVEEHAHRLAASDRLRTRCACAGAGAERGGVPCKKRTRVSPCPGRCERSECRCVTTELDGVDFQDPDAPDGRPDFRRAGAAGLNAGGYGIRKLPMHDAGHRRFRGGRRATCSATRRRCANQAGFCGESSRTDFPSSRLLSSTTRSVNFCGFFSSSIRLQRSVIRSLSSVVT
jgi:hypothetical protein